MKIASLASAASADNTKANQGNGFDADAIADAIADGTLNADATLNADDSVPNSVRNSVRAENHTETEVWNAADAADAKDAISSPSSAVEAEKKVDSIASPPKTLKVGDIVLYIGTNKAPIDR
jgi:hypothetical protein